MAEKSTIARPYAQAVFEMAKSQNDYSGWSNDLALAASVAANPEMKAVVSNPRLSKDQLGKLFLGVCGKSLGKSVENLVHLLIENNRLPFLPEIVTLYESYRAEAEGTIEAEVISAFKVTNALQVKIAEALKVRLGREVSLTCSVDENLLGGAIIRAGDLVIDGSATGQLQKLASALSR